MGLGPAKLSATVPGREPKKEVHNAEDEMQNNLQEFETEDQMGEDHKGQDRKLVDHMINIRTVKG